MLGLEFTSLILSNVKPAIKGKTQQQPYKPQPLIRQLGIYDRGFWQTPRLLAQRTDLTPLEKDILSVLIGLHMDKTAYNIQDGVNPGQTYIAEQTGSTPTSVSKRLISLAAKGYLTIEQRGLNKSNVYRLTGL